MKPTESQDRIDVLGALANSGRELSTAMILFHTNLAKRVGLGPTEEKVIELVQRHEDITVTELANLAGLAKNSLSDALDRLEAKGFIARHAHPSDGRKVSVSVVPEGVARIAAHFTGLMSALADLNAEYSTDELAVVADYQRRAAQIQAAQARALSDE